MKPGDLVRVTKLGKARVGVLIKMPTEKYMVAGLVGQVLIDGELHYAKEEQIELIIREGNHEGS